MPDGGNSPDTLPIVLASKAGVKRDGTQFEGDFYVDGQWMRFQRGLPRKMGGYRRILGVLTGPPRELEVFKIDNYEYVHSGSSSKLERFTLDDSLNPSSISDRTPGGFVIDNNNDWQFGEVYDTATAKMFILAVAAPNLKDIANSAGSPLYFGDATGTAALTAATMPVGVTSISGGVMGLQTYLVYYGSNGLVGWSVSNAPSDLTSAGSGAANVTDQKIVVGLPLRGGGNSPSALLWSLNSIIRMSFIGGSAIWQFDTLTSQSSIISSNSVIEYDGIFYWCGVDRFLTFNGILQELDNDLNLNFFFDNLTPGYEGKTFSMKVPRYGEIWWCACLFGSTEPNWAIIFNVRESRRLGYPVWYDTELPDDLRGAAHYPLNRPSHFMTSALPIPGSGYAFWVHDELNQPDRIEGTSVLAVRSYYETGDYSPMLWSNPTNKGLYVEFIEPDFVQKGTLQIELSGRANARAPQVYGPPRDIVETPVISADELAYFNEQRRELRFRVESNVAGGDYQMGQLIAHVTPADARVTS